jgi:hypothetical protein
MLVHWCKIYVYSRSTLKAVYFMFILNADIMCKNFVTFGIEKMVICLKRKDKCWLNDVTYMHVSQLLSKKIEDQEWVDKKPEIRILLFNFKGMLFLKCTCTRTHDNINLFLRETRNVENRKPNYFYLLWRWIILFLFYEQYLLHKFNTLKINYKPREMFYECFVLSSKTKILNKKGVKRSLFTFKLIKL